LQHTTMMLSRQASDDFLLVDRGLCSNNRNHQDFYLRCPDGFLCSRNLTTRDVAWMEETQGVKKGSLFRWLKAQSAERESPCEYSYEPMERWARLAWLFRGRGERCTEHMLVLRRSDPTSRTFIDWAELKDRAKETGAGIALRRSSRSNVQEVLAPTTPPKLPPPLPVSFEAGSFGTEEHSPKGLIDAFFGEVTAKATLPPLLSLLDDELMYSAGV